ncbi:unnamed protein product [Adineta ricciae]|uniref:NHL repeat containing protein-like protein n=1 Tax=Adineta ricciae TaxID=249248 RepID=A0A814YA11_ADIRI|nr:unnamed protein product [Adineta ricciae]CAF1226458.1 unnamed protein product [Adineta ricciae]
MYIPLSATSCQPTVFNYSTDCNECLCHGINSISTQTFAVNCLTSIRVCLFYSDSSANYSIQWNSTSDLYLFNLSTSVTTETPSFSVGWNRSGVTVAGVTGSPGIAGNLFNHPFCLALDSSNTIYVTDQPNQRVQQWVSNASTGTTVAGQANGTMGSSLEYLCYPSDLVLDSDGNLYIADAGNHRVVLWLKNASTGILVAGTGEFPDCKLIHDAFSALLGVVGSTNSQLANPFGVELDRSTNTLYVADTDNHRIMKYLSNSSSGILVAGGNGPGTGSTQLNNPRGLYFDSPTNSLFIANNYAHNIVRWVLGDSSWTLVAGSSAGVYGTTSMLLYYPTDVTFDSLGNMYVSDEGNHRVQFYLSGQSNGTTIIGTTSVSGSTPELLNTPSSLAVDSEFNVYVVDYNNYRVQEFFHY